MFKRCMRMISLVLVVALLFNLLPAQAMAQYAQANADISDSLPEDAEQAQILGGDKRTVPLSHRTTNQWEYW